MKFNIKQKVKEKSLQERLKHKDSQAFADFYDKNIDDIYRFIYFKVGRRDDANDLSSLVFLKTWEYLQKNGLKDSVTLRALVYKIARNVVIDHYRNSRPDDLSLDDENNKIDVVDENYNLEEEVSDRDDYEKMLHKMMELKNEYREILIMRFVNELSLSEIANISGKKSVNVRVLLHRAIKALKDIMKDDEDKKERKRKSK